MTVDEYPLWRLGDVVCVMVSCCAGAELQLRRVSADGARGEYDVILRELYPTKSDLYERARELQRTRTDFSPGRQGG
jgi:hypothetical protein